MSGSCGLQKGKYAFIVATHTDRAHIHNHFKCNSTLIDGAWKSKGFKRPGLALHKMSDMICREKGLFVIEPRPKSEMARRTDYLKRNTDFVKCAMENDVFGSLLDELGMDE